MYNNDLSELQTWTENKFDGTDLLLDLIVPAHGHRTMIIPTSILGNSTKSFVLGSNSDTVGINSYVSVTDHSATLDVVYNDGQTISNATLNVYGK